MGGESGQPRVTVTVRTVSPPSSGAASSICHAPAGMSEALADKICEVVNSIVDSPEYMQRVKDLGGTNTFQDFTRAEMREMMNRVDEQCKSFFGG